jgi:hypothetical protein
MNTPTLMQSEEERAPWNEHPYDEYDYEQDPLDRRDD